MQYVTLNSTNYPHYRAEIVALYMAAFTTGEYAQHISLRQAKKTMDGLMKISDGVMILINDKPIAIIMAFSLIHDHDFPANEMPYITPKRTIYISELMVDARHRGQGLGTELMNRYLQSVAHRYTDAAIRVWMKNIPALQLYRKLGFTEGATIRQTKLNKTDKKPFEMEKIYLTKRITK